jgi:acetyl esterase/lipase
LIGRQSWSNAAWYIHQADIHARSFPPLLVQAGSAETLLDDSLRIADRARLADVDVTLHVWPDMIHVWHLFAFLVPQAVAAIDEIGAFVRARTGGPPAHPLQPNQ